MTRIQRRNHLVWWVILPPLIITLILAASLAKSRVQNALVEPPAPHNGARP